jgi:hypothetical protein
VTEQADILRVLGQIEGAMGAMQRELQGLRGDVGDFRRLVEPRVRALESQADRARGGLRALLWVAPAMGAATGWIAAWLRGKGVMG